jgi:alkanesulfonate monooxygenase SsuD/methylene tetrahydromethanopterin reductase-like flavin-dependent oxidoreductase (luciferase family)
MALPKVILQLYPMFPAKGEGGRKARRALGTDPDIYHKIIHEWDEAVIEADALGVWGLGTIEHHLHSEGYEVGPNPGVLNARWSTLVKNANIGALGYVMTTQDPIRVAEETAIIDHMCDGRYFVGFARGYQSRWTNILGQFTDTEATVSVKSAADHKNREVFEERVMQVIEAWTEESITFDGKYYQAPYPKETGVANYPAWRIGRAAGAEGEIDENGAVRRVCVVPKPYQKPHPPVMIAASKSPESIQFCARHGFIPTYFMHTLTYVEMANLYVEEGARHGRTYARLARTRTFAVGRTSPRRARNICSGCATTTWTSTRTSTGCSSRSSRRAPTRPRILMRCRNRAFSSAARSTNRSVSGARSTIRRRPNTSP